MPATAKTILIAVITCLICGGTAAAAGEQPALDELTLSLPFEGSAVDSCLDTNSETNGFWSDFTALYAEPRIGAREAGAWLAGLSLAVHYDVPVYNWFQDDLNSPQIHRLSGAVTRLGEWPALAIAGLVWLNDRETGADCFLAMLYAGVNVYALKMTLGMARPDAGVGPVFTGPTIDSDYFAMPSGHTANAFALAVVLADKYPAYRGLIYGAAVLVGLSRIWLERHWPSNVLAGAVIGIYAGQRVLGREYTILRWEF